MSLCFLFLRFHDRLAAFIRMHPWSNQVYPRGITQLALQAAVILLIGLAALPAKAAGGPQSKNTGRPCLSVAEAAQQPNKDICVSAHVFDVVELKDGTRFLDVCSTD